MKTPTFTNHRLAIVSLLTGISAFVLFFYLISISSKALPVVLLTALIGITFAIFGIKTKMGAIGLFINFFAFLFALQIIIVPFLPLDLHIF